jgi:hypoxanthine phosphoribosyltransferase
MSTILSREKIAERTRALGAQITKDYAGTEELVVIGILKGSFIFMADLVREIDLPMSTDFIGLSSYGDETKSSGVVRLTQDLSKPIAGKDVLVVEDIIDTGLTMRYLLENLETRDPKSVKLASLLEKPTNNKSGIRAEYLGFEIEDKFVVGYGLDFKGQYRNVPFVGVLGD